jgi:predicted amidophosphoribosyltransferase
VECCTSIDITQEGEEMKELILDGFFRCSGCGRRYHLQDSLESDAYCDECGAPLEPESEDSGDVLEEESR